MKNFITCFLNIVGPLQCFYYKFILIISAHKTNLGLNLEYGNIIYIGKYLYQKEIFQWDQCL